MTYNEGTSIINQAQYLRTPAEFEAVRYTVYCLYEGTEVYTGIAYKLEKIQNANNMRYTRLQKFCLWCMIQLRKVLG